MDASIVLGGLLSQGLASGGLMGGLSSTITTYADPRLGTILNPDNDPTGVDPRQGTILFPDTGVGVDPRQGTILYPDTDPTGVDPRKGTVIG